MKNAGDLNYYQEKEVIIMLFFQNFIPFPVVNAEDNEVACHTKDEVSTECYFYEGIGIVDCFDGYRCGSYFYENRVDIFIDNADELYPFSFDFEVSFDLYIPGELLYENVIDGYYFDMFYFLMLGQESDTSPINIKGNYPNPMFNFMNFMRAVNPINELEDLFEELPKEMDTDILSSGDASFYFDGNISNYDIGDIFPAIAFHQNTYFARYDDFYFFEEGFDFATGINIYFEEFLVFCSSEDLMTANSHFDYFGYNHQYTRWAYCVGSVGFFNPLENLNTFCIFCNGFNNLDQNFVITSIRLPYDSGNHFPQFSYLTVLATNGIPVKIYDLSNQIIGAGAIILEAFESEPGFWMQGQKSLAVTFEATFTLSLYPKTIIYISFSKENALQYPTLFEEDHLINKLRSNFFNISASQVLHFSCYNHELRYVQFACHGLMLSSGINIIVDEYVEESNGIKIYGTDLNGIDEEGIINFNFMIYKMGSLIIDGSSRTSQVKVNSLKNKNNIELNAFLDHSNYGFLNVLKVEINFLAMHEVMIDNGFTVILSPFDKMLECLVYIEGNINEIFSTCQNLIYLNSSALSTRATFDNSTLSTMRIKKMIFEIEDIIIETDLNIRFILFTYTQKLYDISKKITDFYPNIRKLYSLPINGISKKLMNFYGINFIHSLQFISPVAITSFINVIIMFDAAYAKIIIKNKLPTQAVYCFESNQKLLLFCDYDEYHRLVIQNFQFVAKGSEVSLYFYGLPAANITNDSIKIIFSEFIDLDYIDVNSYYSIVDKSPLYYFSNNGSLYNLFITNLKYTNINKLIDGVNASFSISLPMNLKPQAIFIVEALDNFITNDSSIVIQDENDYIGSFNYFVIGQEFFVTSTKSIQMGTQLTFTLINIQNPATNICLKTPFKLKLSNNNYDLLALTADAYNSNEQITFQDGDITQQEIQNIVYELGGDFSLPLGVFQTVPLKLIKPSSTYYIIESNTVPVMKNFLKARKEIFIGDIGCFYPIGMSIYTNLLFQNIQLTAQSPEVLNKTFLLPLMQITFYKKKLVLQVPDRVIIYRGKNLRIPISYNGLIDLHYFSCSVLYDNEAEQNIQIIFNSRFYLGPDNSVTHVSIFVNEEFRYHKKAQIILEIVPEYSELFITTNINLVYFKDNIFSYFKFLSTDLAIQNADFHSITFKISTNAPIEYNYYIVKASNYGILPSEMIESKIIQGYQYDGEMFYGYGIIDKKYSYIIATRAGLDSSEDYTIVVYIKNPNLSLQLTKNFSTLKSVLPDVSFLITFVGSLNLDQLSVLVCRFSKILEYYMNKIASFDGKMCSGINKWSLESIVKNQILVSEQTESEIFNLHDNDNSITVLEKHRIFILFNSQNYADDALIRYGNANDLIKSSAFYDLVASNLQDFPKFIGVRFDGEFIPKIPNFVIVPNFDILSLNSVKLSNIQLDGIGIVILAIVSKKNLNLFSNDDLALGKVNLDQIYALGYTIINEAYEEYEIILNNLPSDENLSALYVIRGDIPLSAAGLYSGFYRIDFKLSSKILKQKQKIIIMRNQIQKTILA